MSGGRRWLNIGMMMMMESPSKMGPDPDQWTGISEDFFRLPTPTATAGSCPIDFIVKILMTFYQIK